MVVAIVKIAMLKTFTILAANFVITLNERASSKRKNPAKPEVKKLIAKFVTVACRDDRAFRLFT